ncbi:3-oxoacyl-ACP synthase III [Pseudokineococcus sp. 1T1Z-3]|uniref:3-oxoacyl-ACP synthase III n=1 Tax=Pseudokineococcus sp. 1T1Z-3 TaxID=3132745 RepID=UPI00309869F5
MSGNSTIHHERTALLATSAVEAPVVVTSDSLEERLEPTLRRLRLRSGSLATLAGITERRWWGPDEDAAGGAARAGRQALEAAGVEPGQVGLLINTSVYRANLEPSVAVGIHHELGLPTSALNFDITNACLGFVNALTVAAAMIDGGAVRYALVVDGEDARPVHESTIAQLSAEDATRRDFVDAFATLTLGSGAAAAVLGPADDHAGAPRVLGGVSRTHSAAHRLCVGGNDGMVTDAKGLLDEGVGIIGDAWDDALAEGWSWKDMDRYLFHQVSTVHTRALVERLGVDTDRVPLTFPRWGNVGPAALPMTLAMEAPSLRSGDRVLCLGVGSGLNTTLTEIQW